MNKLRDKFSLLELTDGYKLTHWDMFLKSVTKATSYFESRGGVCDEIVPFGMQYIIREYLTGQVFGLNDINELDRELNHYFGKNGLFNVEGWTKMFERYGGRLPVRIKTIPEGSIIKPGNVIMTIESTDPDFVWLPNYLETLLVQSWYPSTVATYSRECKKIILKYLKKTGTPELVGYKLHDFGFRGVSSVETSRIGGAAHLVNFLGTDTYSAIRLLKTHYLAGDNIAESIPASEHMIPMMYGKDNELDYYRDNIIRYKDGMLSLVSDTWDIMNVCEKILPELNDLMESQSNTFTLVVRPDSGNPNLILPKVFEALFEKFGYSFNDKGYKVLPNYLRVIQGDGVNIDSIESILENLEAHDISADNITFGSGGKLLQAHDRDELQFAFKGCSIVKDGIETGISKDPITSKAKRSKHGVPKLIKTENGYETIVPGHTSYDSAEDELVEVFLNGEHMTMWDLDSIRERAKL